MNNLLAAAGGGGIPSITNPALGSTLGSYLAGGGGLLFFQTLLTLLITLAFVGGAILFVFMLLIGGIQWITAGGDKAALENAKSRVTQALIGIVILFSVYAIITFIQNLFGINILVLDIGSLIIK